MCDWKTVTAIGFVTGSVSQRVVVDVDPRNGGTLEAAYGLGLPPTRTVVTGSGGHHLHYRIPVNARVKSRKLADGIEVKGEGGFVVLPPSLHPETGQPYRWQDETAPIAELPEAFWRPEAKAGAPVIAKDKAIAELLRGVPQGERDNAAIRLAGRLVAKGLSDDEIELLLLAWNDLNQPPMGQAEGDPDPVTWVREKIASARRMEEEKKQANSLRLPDEYYLGLAAEYTNLMRPHYEVPAEYWYFDYLTILGARLAGKVTLASDIEPDPRLYEVKLGRSGIEKKSTSQARTLRHFQDVGVAPAVCHGVGSAEGLAEALRENPVLLLVCDEFRAVLAKARIENSVLGEMLARLYEQTRYQNRVKGRNIDLKEARLSLIGAATIDSYQLAWSPVCLATGLTNRIFLVYGEAEGSVPFVGLVDPLEEARLQQNLAALVEEAERRAAEGFKLVIGGREWSLPDKLCLRLTPEAEKLWREWYESRPRDMYAVRLDGLGQRLMILLALTQGNFETVDERTVRAVCGILDWEHRVRLAFDPIDAETLVARMEESIRRQLAARGSLTKSELEKLTNARRVGKWVFNTAWQNLLNDREIRVEGKHATLG